MLALVIGVTRLVIAFVYKGEGYCGEDKEVPAILADFHYMYFALFITALTAVVAIIISYFTGRPEPKYVRRQHCATVVCVPSGWLVAWLVAWLVGWLVGFVGWLAGWLVGWLVG